MPTRRCRQEQGINPLFDDRVDEAMIYDAALQSQLPKREEKPDRVYGLRKTKRLERLLVSAEGLRTSPFRPDGEPILFPFLILEAKSEKAADSFTDIEVQTAFAIRELLRLQDGLRQAADEDEDWEAGPFVWFLSYKGEQWRVSAAYIERRDLDRPYVSIQSNPFHSIGSFLYFPASRSALEWRCKFKRRRTPAPPDRGLHL
jgi:hypothetical protein